MGETNGNINIERNWDREGITKFFQKNFYDDKENFNLIYVLCLLFMMIKIEYDSLVYPKIVIAIKYEFFIV